MMRTGCAMGVLAATMIAAAGTPAGAEVLEATYRGTMVCDTLPFVNIVLRGAIEVTVTARARSVASTSTCKAPGTWRAALRGEVQR